MEIMLSILLLMLIDGLVSGARRATLCTSDACFTFHNDRMSFEAARVSCDHNGGYLMTVRDPEEEEVLRSLLAQIHRQRQDKALKFWIGLKLRSGSCVSTTKALRGFEWASGEEDSHYSNWEKEPVLTCTEEMCVRVNYATSAELKWHAGPCRSNFYYACKFNFRGMCKPLALLGSGQVTYTAPFSPEPQRSEMQLFPLGTYAVISCPDQQSHYSVCKGTDGVYRWSVPGLFCRGDERDCAVNNGGCEHLCNRDADEVRCSCDGGYTLEEDGLHCRVRDLCGVDTCSHQCVTGEFGYSCKCPNGFMLEDNQRNCSDVNECQSGVCRNATCLNTPGSYTCVCKDGYQLLDGGCRDVDECGQAGCEHGCSNSVGSFSCSCNEGFTLSEDGRSCVHVHKCVSNGCQFGCVDTLGGVFCTCPQGFHLEMDGSTCAPDSVEFSGGSSVTAEEPAENSTDSSPGTTVEVQHRPPHTDAPLPEVVNVTHDVPQSNVSLVTSVAMTANTRMLVCILGSVIPLLLLVAVTLAIAIYRCRRAKKEVKKNATTDGYCWVSSGLDPRLEKLYDSILTDDL